MITLYTGDTFFSISQRSWAWVFGSLPPSYAGSHRPGPCDEDRAPRPLGSISRKLARTCSCGEAGYL